MSVVVGRVSTCASLGVGRPLRKIQDTTTP